MTYNRAARKLEKSLQARTMDAPSSDYSAAKDHSRSGLVQLSVAATQVSSLAFPEVTVVVESGVVRACRLVERPLTATLPVGRSRLLSPCVALLLSYCSSWSAAVTRPRLCCHRRRFPLRWPPTQVTSKYWRLGITWTHDCHTMTRFDTCSKWATSAKVKRHRCRIIGRDSTMKNRLVSASFAQWLRTTISVA